MFASPGAIAFQVGPLSIRWYGVIMAAAVLLGATLAYREASRRGQAAEHLLNLVVAAVLVGVVGARLYYVLFNWDYYSVRPAKILALWEGGLAIHGGFISGTFAVAAFWRSVRLAMPVVLDILTPGVALGQAVGRWGNFFNQEAFGAPTSLPWKLYVEPAYRPPELAGVEYFHPTFLYESLWNLAVFAVLWFGLRRRLEKQPGALALCFVGLYSMGRYAVEGLGLDSLMLHGIRAAQAVSLLLLAGSSFALLVMALRGWSK